MKNMDVITVSFNEMSARELAEYAEENLMNKCDWCSVGNDEFKCFDEHNYCSDRIEEFLNADS